jgi:serine protease Do
MRSIFAGLVLFAVGCAPAHTTPASLASETVALVRPSLDGPRAYCSGVWVKPDEFVTAAHCVEDRDEVAYLVPDDHFDDDLPVIRFGHVGPVDTEHDIALVHVKAPPPHAVAPLAAASAGQEVRTMGHPLGLWWSYSTGTVSAVRALYGMRYVQSTAPISPGNSGGGLFDSSGALLGVAVFYMPRGENLNFFVHSDYVRELIIRDAQD